MYDKLYKKIIQFIVDVHIIKMLEMQQICFIVSFKQPTLENWDI